MALKPARCIADKLVDPGPQSTMRSSIREVGIWHQVLDRDLRAESHDAAPDTAPPSKSGLCVEPTVGAPTKSSKTPKFQFEPNFCPVPLRSTKPHQSSAHSTSPVAKMENDRGEIVDL